MNWVTRLGCLSALLLASAGISTAADCSCDPCSSGVGTCVGAVGGGAPLGLALELAGIPRTLVRLRGPALHGAAIGDGSGPKDRTPAGAASALVAGPVDASAAPALDGASQPQSPRVRIMDPDLALVASGQDLDFERATLAHRGSDPRRAQRPFDPKLAVSRREASRPNGEGEA